MAEVASRTSSSSARISRRRKMIIGFPDRAITLFAGALTVLKPPGAEGGPSHGVRCTPRQFGLFVQRLTRIPVRGHDTPGRCGSHSPLAPLQRFDFNRSTCEIRKKASLGRAPSSNLAQGIVADRCERGGDNWRPKTWMAAKSSSPTPVKRSRQVGPAP